MESNEMDLEAAAKLFATIRQLKLVPEQWVPLAVEQGIEYEHIQMAAEMILAAESRGYKMVVPTADPSISDLQDNLNYLVSLVTYLCEHYADEDPPSLHSWVCESMEGLSLEVLSRIRAVTGAKMAVSEAIATLQNLPDPGIDT